MQGGEGPLTGWSCALWVHLRSASVGIMVSIGRRAGRMHERMGEDLHERKDLH